MGGRQPKKNDIDDEPTPEDIAIVRQYEGKGEAEPSAEDLEAARNLDSIAAAEKPDSSAEDAMAAATKEPERLPTSEGENITASIMPWHKDVQKLADARLDDPRVIEISPQDTRLVLDNFQIRREVSNPWRLDQLQQSLLEDGQQKPVIVARRMTDDSKEQLIVIAGHGRVLAARKRIKKAKEGEEKPRKLEKIYVLPVELTDEQAFYLALWSNLDNRLPMDALDEDDEAKAIERLINDYKWTQQRVADALHRNQSWISRRLKRLHVDDQVERMVKSGDISESHAEVIMTLPKDLQSDLADGVVNDEMTVAQTQKVVASMKAVIKTGEELKVPEDIVLEVAESVQQGNVDSETGSKIMRAVQPIAEDLKKLVPSSWERSDIIEKLVEEKGEAKVATDTIEALKKVQEAPLPAEAKKHLSDRVKRERVIPETVPLLVTNVAKTLGFSDGIPRYAKTKLWENVADEKYEIGKAEKIASTVKSFLEAPPLDKADQNIREAFAETVVEKGHSDASAQKIVDYVKLAIDAKKSPWEIRSDIRDGDWKKGLKEPAEPKKYIARTVNDGGKPVLKLQCHDCNRFIFLDPKTSQYWMEQEDLKED